ncbi:molecular chaperone [Dechloromonas sp. HYN0024]|uniref:TorD/DmsD family molecular chaperone n=1 Tax=Dechloromonas sp. HYN0024 TaxID=2231055 RepID=UPI000E443697|nr:molecular chaperone TorD family protein [Dechloromonas sp. HYN0024]AXS79543.1 dehydrogenase [Dechloromonas sp. HYN0024]
MMIDRETALAWSDDVATLAILHDREMTLGMIGGVKAIGFPGNLGMVPRGESGSQIYDAMREVVAALPDMPDQVFMDNLAADYAAIYLTGGLDASPFESFWVSDEHLVCQDAMFDMRELYAADGLAVPNWRLRPDDHLVFQLQFLARRLDRIAALSDADSAQISNDLWRSLATLLDHHLLRWLPDFASRVSARCDTEFYAALFLLTNIWCEQLRDFIALHLGTPRPSKEQIEATLRPKHLDEVKTMPIQFMPGIGGPGW